ncbi:RRM domain protein [Pseudoloma neurophilia]|uniref:RRM domain protein n=1 Tax=Pseudoloma neurophilia TaxID=146866 RepID=A0A0R0LW15_9MICR|nr:RRM domain protein [Pseudoloma neurophilia]
MSIEKRLDFYFSNPNYFRDTFLKTKCEEDGGISIETILTFQKLKELNATADDIKNAVKNTKNVKLEDDKLVKIKDKSYEEYTNRKHDDYTVIIDGLNTDLKLEEIEEYLSQFIKPILIRMKRDAKKQFTGAVLVEFDSIEEANQALEMEIPAHSSTGQSTIPENKKYIAAEGKKDIVAENKSDIAAEGKEDIVAENKTNIVAEGKKDVENKTVTELKSEQANEAKENKSPKIENKTAEAKSKDDAKKKKAVQEPVKKLKPNNLTILTKKDYQNKLQDRNNKKNKTTHFMNLNKNKVFRFEAPENLEIKDIKTIVKNVAFVDLKNKVLRFKHGQEKTEQTVEEIKMTLLPDDELKKYVDDVVFVKKDKKFEKKIEKKRK